MPFLNAHWADNVFFLFFFSDCWIRCSFPQLQRTSALDIHSRPLADQVCWAYWSGLSWYSQQQTKHCWQSYVRFFTFLSFVLPSTTSGLQPKHYVDWYTLPFLSIRWTITSVWMLVEKISHPASNSFVLSTPCALVSLNTRRNIWFKGFSPNGSILERVLTRPSLG